MACGDPDKLFDFIVDRYAFQEPFEVFLVTGNEEAFIKVGSSFTDLPNKFAKEVLQAYVMCHWRRFDTSLYIKLKKELLERTKEFKI